MINVFGYVRVSTKKQIEGHSLDYQKEAIEKFCKFKDYNLIKIYEDKGISSYKDRKQHKKMMKRLLSDDSIDGVVVNDLTRFGRSTQDLLIQIHDIDNSNKKFISVKDNIDISTKTGRLMLKMLSAIADYEAETIRERMQAGREWAQEHGTKSGKPIGRPQADIDWNKVRELRKHNISWNKTSNVVGVSTPTLIKRAKDKGIF